MIVNISTLQLAVVFKKSFIHELHADNATFNSAIVVQFLQKTIPSQKKEVSLGTSNKIKNYCFRNTKYCIGKIQSHHIQNKPTQHYVHPISSPSPHLHPPTLCSKYSGIS